MGAAMSSDLLAALLQALHPLTLALVAGGVLLGLIFGIIPGLTATLAVVLLIPLTYGLDPLTGISLLIGVYIGGISGGMVSAILLGMPGTPSSICTSFDGFPMAKRGLAGKALHAAAVANLVGTLVSWVFLIALTSQLANFALRFGPFEYAAVIVFGLTTIVSLSGDSVFKGFIGTLFGLAVCTIGLDPLSGLERSVFGIEALRSGISPVPAMIGLFVVAEVFRNLEDGGSSMAPPDMLIDSRQTLSLKELKTSAGNMIRSSLVGLGIGLLPGIGGSLSNFVAYDQAKKASPEPESFGQGNMQGIIAAETANNATIGGALIPTLALGIPGDVVTAALIGGLQLHGLDPGPLLFAEKGDFVIGLYAAFLIAALCMFLFLYFLGTRYAPHLLRVPKKYLLPVVLLACTAGCYNLNYSTSDMWIALIFGCIGYVLNKYKYPLAPIVISMVLGRTFERQLRTGLIQSDGSFLPFVLEPIPAAFLVVAVLSLIYALWRHRGQDARKAR